MKKYRFVFDGSLAEFENLVEKKSEEIAAKEMLLKKLDGKYAFGLGRSGHSGGEWYIPSYTETGGKLLLEGKIVSVDGYTDEFGNKKFRDKVYDVLLSVILFPLYIILGVIIYPVHIVIALLKGEKPDFRDEEVKNLEVLMTEILDCRKE